MQYTRCLVSKKNRRNCRGASISESPSHYQIRLLWILHARRRSTTKTTAQDPRRRQFSWLYCNSMQIPLAILQPIARTISSNSISCNPRSCDESKNDRFIAFYRNSRRHSFATSSELISKATRWLDCRFWWEFIFLKINSFVESVVLWIFRASLTRGLCKFINAWRNPQCKRNFHRREFAIKEILSQRIYTYAEQIMHRMKLKINSN